jgi:hypothetical protein
VAVQPVNAVHPTLCVFKRSSERGVRDWGAGGYKRVRYNRSMRYIRPCWGVGCDRIKVWVWLEQCWGGKLGVKGRVGVGTCPCVRVCCASEAPGLLHHTHSMTPHPRPPIPSKTRSPLTSLSRASRLTKCAFAVSDPIRPRPDSTILHR